MKVSRSSPENSRPEACYFPITRILDVFKEISKYFDLFCVEKSLAAKIQHIFKEKILEKFFRTHRKNLSGLTGQICPDSPEKFFRQTYLHLIHILKNDKCKCSVQYVWGKICGIYNKSCMYSTTIFQLYILHSTFAFSSCPNNYVGRALGF